MSNIIFMARLNGSDYHSNAARVEKLLNNHGFSVGRMQAHEPRGILFGEFDIQKWRNLSRQNREELHGLMSGSHHASISIEISDDAPLDAVSRLAKSLAKEGATILRCPPEFPEIKPSDVTVVSERRLS